MINQSKTLLSFLVPSLPLRIEEYQREVGSEPEQDPSEPSEAQKPLHVSYFLFVEKGFGEGNGTPLQYFCLENPMDGGAW